MAGKIHARVRGERSGGDKNIPTAKWEVQNQAKPESAGATTAGAQLHAALQRSRGTGLKTP